MLPARYDDDDDDLKQRNERTNKKQKTQSILFDFVGIIKFLFHVLYINKNFRLISYFAFF